LPDVLSVLTNEELDSIIADNDSVVVLFFDPIGCAPCKRFHPHFVKAATINTDSVFVEVDVTKAETYDIAVEYGVMSVPQVKMIRDAEVRDIKSRTLLPLLEEIK